METVGSGIVNKYFRSVILRESGNLGLTNKIASGLERILEDPAARADIASRLDGQTDSGRYTFNVPYRFEDVSFEEKSYSVGGYARKDEGRSYARVALHYFLSHEGEEIDIGTIQRCVGWKSSTLLEGMKYVIWLLEYHSEHFKITTKGRGESRTYKLERKTAAEVQEVLDYRIERAARQ